MGLTSDQAEALGVRVDPAPAPDGPFARAARAKKQAEAEAAAAAGDTRTPEQRRQAKQMASRAQAAGEKHEQAVLRACGVYLRRGVAHIEKRNPGVKFGQGGKPIPLPGGEDFEGWLIGGGRHVCFEAKADSGASLSLSRPDGKKKQRPTLTPLQRRRLARAHRDGCLAGVLVRIVVQRDGDKVGRWFWLRWPEYLAAERAAKAGGAKSISQDLLERHGVECDTRRMHGAPDWLTAALDADAVEEAA